jgi:hypothetical protein
VFWRRRTASRSRITCHRCSARLRGPQEHSKPPTRRREPQRYNPPGPTHPTLLCRLRYQTNALRAPPCNSLRCRPAPLAASRSHVRIPCIMPKGLGELGDVGVAASSAKQKRTAKADGRAASKTKQTDGRQKHDSSLPTNPASMSLSRYTRQERRRVSQHIQKTRRAARTAKALTTPTFEPPLSPDPSNPCPRPVRSRTWPYSTPLQAGCRHASVRELCV